MTLANVAILVHGFFRTSQDMFLLKLYLEEKNYRGYTINLPTTLASLDECTQVLKREMQLIHKEGIHKLFFVGHSMGGLIIRNYLSENFVPNIGRCVLIATPNSGSRLADLALTGLRLAPMNPIRSLEALQTKAPEIPPPLNDPPPEIGVIAGNQNNLLLGRLLPSKNDGRVEIESTFFPGMKEYIVLPFNHHEIHHKEETAKLVWQFLEYGAFTLIQQRDGGKV
jgi:pimeloyl-ACP methyl ester carboxylesterase